MLVFGSEGYLADRVGSCAGMYDGSFREQRHGFEMVYFESRWSMTVSTLGSYSALGYIIGWLLIDSCVFRVGFESENRRARVSMLCVFGVAISPPFLERLSVT